MNIKINDQVRWSTSKIPLGVVIHKFTHKDNEYAVVERPNGVLTVVRIYELLEKV